MQVSVNGVEHTAQPEEALLALLQRLDVPTEAVAVALNLEVVPRAKLATTRLSPGDRVEVVRAVGGG